MKVLYQSEKLKKQCTSLREATKFFGGDKSLAVSLLSRINALEQAETIHDIIVQPSFRFHDLHKKDHRNREGTFAIDVKSIRHQWRLILEPLNTDEEVYVSCNIDEISKTVKVVKVLEVSKHYG